jgi:hypothetical protein
MALAALPAIFEIRRRGRRPKRVREKGPHRSLPLARTEAARLLPN